MSDDISLPKRRRSDRAVDKVLGPDGAKRQYLSRPTVVDKVLAVTILPLIPRFVTPNQITVFRFITIPFVLALLFVRNYPAATALFAIAAFSDALDGAIARTRGQVTPWGIVFDPVADKLLIGTTAIMLVASALGVFLATTIVVLELALISSVYFRYSGRIVPAKTAGKIKMILQCIGIGLLLLGLSLDSALLVESARYTLYGAIVFALMSLFVYRSI